MDEELELRSRLSQAFGILSSKELDPEWVAKANEKMSQVIDILNGNSVIEESSQT